MRIIILLNPTNKYGTKTEYTILRNFLKKDGYLHISADSYMRITNNRKGAEKHLKRLNDYWPRTGQITILRLTEKQFSDSYTTFGETNWQEKIVGSNNLIML